MLHHAKRTWGCKRRNHVLRWTTNPLIPPTDHRIDVLMKTTRKMTRLLIAAVPCFTAISCDSSDTTMSTIALAQPLAQRQALALEDSTLRADVVINNGTVQSFTFRPQEDNLVTVGGIRLNENNNITVTWTEILNGFDVEISEQSQLFFASGNININAPHETDQYDYDSDGVANFDERVNGTCVWSADNECLQDGQLDIPTASTPSPPVPPLVTATNGRTEVEANAINPLQQLATPFDYNNADNIIENGDFSDGIGEWFTNESLLFDGGGEICATNPTMDGIILNTLFAYRLLLPIRETRYSFEFDMRADRDSAVVLTIAGQSSFLEQFFAVTQTAQPIVIPMVVSQDVNQSSSINFQALHHPTIPTTYCMDNIRVYIER